MRLTFALSLVPLVPLAACGNPNKDQLQQNADFDCHDRYAAYTATGSLAGAEVGVQVDCAEHGPRVVRWTVTNDGNREEYSGSLGVNEFDHLVNLTK